MNDDATPRRGFSLGTKILIGVVAGIVCGSFFEAASPSLQVVGEVYVGLLQMTVLPYVTVALVGKIGGLTLVEARGLAGRAGVVMVALWVMSLAMVVVMPLSLPDWEAGTFFSSSLVSRPESLDFFELYVPTNPFHALANNIVPATVVFSLIVGVALIEVPGKRRVLEPLDVVGDALSRIAGFVVRLAPWGTFALTAGAMGTLAPSDMMRLIGYVSTFTVAVLFLTFVALPGFVAALTPIRWRELLGAFRDAGLTAFATGKLFAILPIVINDVQDLLHRRGVPEGEARATASVYVPLTYPFPNAGRILTLLFIPFVAWFIDRPLESSDYPALLSVGLLSLFGSPVAAIPFLLDMMRLPTDLFPLFLVTGIWCARVGDVLGTMHLSVITVLCAAWEKGWLVVRPARLGIWLAYSAAIGAAAVAVNGAIVSQALLGRDPPQSIVARMTLLEEVTTITIDDEAGRNPVSLAPGESRLDRIRRAGELRVGYPPHYPPFCYRNTSGALVGFDVDLVQRLAHALEVKLRLVPYDINDRLSPLQEDHFDVAIGGIASSIDNFGIIHETEPYLTLHAAVLVPDHRVREFRTLDMIRKTDGLRIGYTSNGYFARATGQRFPGLEIVELPSIEVFVNGERPDVDALLTTAEEGAFLSMLYPSYSVVVPEGARARVPIVFAVQVADELDRLVDTWIRLKREDGTLDDLFAYWIQGETSGR